MASVLAGIPDYQPANVVLGGAAQANAGPRAANVQTASTDATAPQQPLQNSPAVPAQTVAQPTQPSPMWKRILEGALEGLAGGAAQPGGLGASGGFGGIGAGYVAAQSFDQRQQDRQAQQARQKVVQSQQDQAASDAHQVALANVNHSQVTTSAAAGESHRAGIKFNDDQTANATAAANLVAAAPGSTLIAGADGKPVDNLGDAFKYHGGVNPATKQFVGGKVTAVPIGGGKYQFYTTPHDWFQAPTTEPTPFRQFLGIDPTDNKPMYKPGEIPAGATNRGNAFAFVNAQNKNGLNAQVALAKDANDNANKLKAARVAAAKKNADGGVGTADPILVDQIGTGHVVPERLAYLLTRNPALVGAVGAKYPNWNSSKAQAYPSVYKEFTSTKKGTAGLALNSGSTALVHLAELRSLNTPESHIYGTPAYTAYKNKTDTLATELATFYGDTTIPAIDSIKSTLMSTLPGNRNAAIVTQAQSMGDKFDSYEQTWNNAAPSPYFQSPMPGISAKAMAARASLDPAYAKRRAAALTGQQAQPQQVAQQPQQAARQIAIPVGAQIGRDARGNPVGYRLNGQYVSLTGGR